MDWPQALSVMAETGSVASLLDDSARRALKGKGVTARGEHDAMVAGPPTVAIGRETLRMSLPTVDPPSLDNPLPFLVCLPSCDFDRYGLQMECIGGLPDLDTVLPPSALSSERAQQAEERLLLCLMHLRESGHVDHDAVRSIPLDALCADACLYRSSGLGQALAGFPAHSLSRLLQMLADACEEQQRMGLARLALFMFTTVLPDMLTRDDEAFTSEGMAVDDLEALWIERGYGQLQDVVLRAMELHRSSPGEFDALLALADLAAIGRAGSLAESRAVTWYLCSYEGAFRTDLFAVR